MLAKNNFNPRSPCGERPALYGDAFKAVHISTHAPRAGSDGECWGTVDESAGFQPTLPVRGATHSISSQKQTSRKFQPTLPVRGATLPPLPTALHSAISTHAPRAGSDRYVPALCKTLTISTHAPRAGSDTNQDGFDFLDQQFQPTLPVRGATASTNKFEALILYHKYNFGIIP